jgi:hypothetical protein
MDVRWVFLPVGEFEEEVEVVERRAAARLVRANFDGCYSWELDVRRTGNESTMVIADECVLAMVEAYKAVVGRAPASKLTTRWARGLEVFWSNGLVA